MGDKIAKRPILTRFYHKITKKVYFTISTCPYSVWTNLITQKMQQVYFVKIQRDDKDEDKIVFFQSQNDAEKFLDFFSVF